MKKNSVSLDDITKKEISIVEANDKLSKLEKERTKDRKIIAEYKEREKATARALILYERKIKFLKESAVENLLAVCTEIAKTKEMFSERASKISSDFIRNDMLEYKDTYAFFENKIYDVCNLLEKNALLSNEERDFIANRKRETIAEDDIQSRFDRLKQEFSQKIGSSVTRKRGRPRKDEQSIIADIGLRKKVEKQVEDNERSKDRINEIFYDMPENKKITSSIPTTADSLFDFEEALNPNLSLKDIMEDIMTEKKEDVLVYDENVRKIKDSQKQSDIELLESGFIKPRKSMKTHTNVQNRTIDNMPKRPTYEKRFLSIGNIVKDASKK